MKQPNSMMPTQTMSSPWTQSQMGNPMMTVNSANGNWTGVNPFGSSVSQNNQMNTIPTMQQTAPPVTSANNPFDLF